MVLVDLVTDISVSTTNNFFSAFQTCQIIKMHLKVGCNLIYLYAQLKKHPPSYSKLCYFCATKGEMMKFAAITPNCVGNNL